MVADQVAAQFGSTWEKSTKWDALLAKCGGVFLTKPISYMNRSGYPLLAIAPFYKIDPPQILVMLDDMALPLGRLSLRLVGGSGGDNGLEAVVLQLVTESHPR